MTDETHKDEPENRNDCHEYAGAFSKCHCVDLDKGLGCLESEQSVQVWGAKQK